MGALSGKSLFDLSDDENDFNADDKITSTNYVETEQIIKEGKATSDNLQPYKRKKCRAILELESVRNNDSCSDNKTDNNSCDTNLSKDNIKEDGFDFSDDDEFVAAIAEEESSSKETGEKRVLSQTEKDRAERNRLKALTLKKSRVLSHP